MKNKKIILTKQVTSKFELERIEGKWVVWEYETALLQDNLELDDEEAEEFIKGWEKEGYKKQEIN